MAKGCRTFGTKPVPAKFRIPFLLSSNDQPAHQIIGFFVEFWIKMMIRTVETFNQYRTSITISNAPAKLETACCHCVLSVTNCTGVKRLSVNGDSLCSSSALHFQHLHSTSNYSTTKCPFSTWGSLAPIY